MLSLTACTSPPSVTPLLRATDRALEAEARHLQTDLAQTQQSLNQSRLTLEQGFIKDLETQTILDKQWVLEASELYAVAREQLLIHQMEIERQYQHRRDNLELASQAQQRAITLLENQDRLITHTLGFDLWAWTQQPNFSGD